MLVICDLDEGCLAPDGTIQPRGTAFNRILADAGFSLGPGLKLIDDDGRVIYTPAPPPPALVAVSNSAARRVLQMQFVPSGSSFFTVVNTYLQQQMTATASLPDKDPNRIAALGSWTQWDMGNFFDPNDPLVDAMVVVIQEAGGTIDKSALFQEAVALGG